MILSDLSFNEIIDYVKARGLPRFRGEQLFDAIYQGKALDEISNLPKGLKEQLQDVYPKYKILYRFVGKDGTKKYLVALDDECAVECVLMKYKYGYTICISTQVGCRMGCKFCASTLKGLKRNLSAGEMIGQILLVNRDIDGKGTSRNITNVVLMGSGEPLDNYDNVVKFINLASSPKGLNISQRNISLSTCGIVDKIYQLAELKLNITLTISLHATTDENRKKIMPIANKYSIDEIIKACKDYFEKTKRKIYFEYTLVQDINDSDEDVKRLAQMLKGMTCHVNVIPLNDVKERSLKKTTRLMAYQFVEKLKKAGVSATVRRTMGEDIGGACGQLRNTILGI